MAKLEALARQRRAVLHLSSCFIFHPFVEQLPSSIHLDSFWRHLLSSKSLTSISTPSRDGILSGTCQKVRKLCINLYISIVNRYRQTYKHTYIQAQPQTKAPLVPGRVCTIMSLMLRHSAIIFCIWTRKSTKLFTGNRSEYFITNNMRRGKGEPGTASHVILRHVIKKKSVT